MERKKVGSGFKMKSPIKKTKAPLKKFSLGNLADKMPTSNLGIAAGIAGIGTLGYLIGKKKKNDSYDRTR